MPIYQYKCQKCGYLKEVMQKINDAPLEICSKCKGKFKKLIAPEFKKLIAPVGLIFKGSGFHITDYKTHKKVSHETKKTQAEEPKKTSSETSKTDTAASKPKENKNA
ncbi:MAG: zinc ribbon domain-containing protein [Armatimonadetes bacterium]|nr:zinc ribbon domain-containing protein [Armatimonadota bacterium]